MGFVCNGKGYLCGGNNQNYAYYSSLWEYDPSPGYGHKREISQPEKSGWLLHFLSEIKDMSVVVMIVHLYTLIFISTTDNRQLDTDADIPWWIQDVPYAFYCSWRERLCEEEEANYQKWMTCGNSIHLPICGFKNLLCRETRGNVLFFLLLIMELLVWGSRQDSRMFWWCVQVWSSKRFTAGSIADFNPGGRAWVATGFAYGDNIYMGTGWNFSTFTGISICWIYQQESVIRTIIWIMFWHINHMGVLWLNSIIRNDESTSVELIDAQGKRVKMKTSLIVAKECIRFIFRVTEFQPNLFRKSGCSEWINYPWRWWSMSFDENTWRLKWFKDIVNNCKYLCDY